MENSATETSIRRGDDEGFDSSVLLSAFVCLVGCHGPGLTIAPALEIETFALEALRERGLYSGRPLFRQLLVVFG